MHLRNPPAKGGTQSSLKPTAVSLCCCFCAPGPHWIAMGQRCAGDHGRHQRAKVNGLGNQSDPNQSVDWGPEHENLMSLPKAFQGQSSKTLQMGVISVQFSPIFTSEVLSTKVAFVDDANESSPLLSRIPIDVWHCCLRFSFCFPSAFSDSSSFPLSYQGQPASVVLSSTWEPRFPSNSQSLLGHSVSHQLGAVLDKQHGLQRIPLWAPLWSLPVMCPSWDYSIHRETDHR